MKNKKNMKKLKNSVKITLVILAVCFVNLNCSEDKLDQVNPNSITPSSFWKTEADATKGVIGAYAPFTNIWYYTRFEIFASDYRDDVINGYNTSPRTAAGYFGALSDSNVSFWVWQAMFQGVARANEVVFRVPQIENIDATVRDNITGEGYFIRAFNYFNLLNNWRNIPLITLPTSEIEDLTAIPQADPAEVWGQIESDLQQAQNLLPVSWPVDQAGRATSGAATGMLGKVYLYQGKYAEAKAEFQKVMSSGTYQLMDDYFHNFTEEFENNAESLFEIQLVADGLGGWGADNANSGKGSAYQPDLAPIGYTNQNTMRVNQWALDLFLDEQTTNGEIDPRTFITFFWNTEETTEYQGNTLRSRTYQNTSYTDAFSATATEIYGNKWSDWEFNGKTQSLDGGWHGGGNNLRLLRYADVLLMFAEAEFMLNGSTQAALDAINEVRARADMAPHASITMQDIEDERIKELTFERTRYFDLLRWGRVKSRIVDNPDLKSESAGTGAYQPGREYLAIPENDIVRNPLWTQNDGY